MPDIREQASALALVVREHVSKAFSPLAARIKALEDREPVKGLDGRDGKDGADGRDGTSVTVDELRPMIEGLVREAVASLPAPKDGEPGKDGRDGQDGKDGTDGKDGADGKDAEPVSEKAIADAVAAMFERRFSDLVLSWERQVRDETQRALDRMPAPKDGRDGKDAAPIESLEVTQNERVVTLRLGDVERTIILDTILDRGVWEQGAYDKGDAVTYGGSLWIAQQTTDEAPGTSKAWRLAVKKGRDGRDLRETASRHDKTRGVEIPE